MMDRFTTTNPLDQDEVQGYLTKNDAQTVAKIYFFNAQVMKAFGNDASAAFYEGYGYGLMAGAK